MMQLQASEQEIDWLEGKSKYLTGQAGDDMDGGFFEHYRFINLEHISNFRYYPANPDMTGKYTVEFRNFRPPPSPEHAQAVAELLLAIMKYQARSNHLEPFEWVSPESYELFMTGSAIESNWQKIKQQLKLNNPYLDSMIQEYVTAIHAKRTFAGLPKGIEIFEAYSEKIDKGTRFEVRFDGEIYTNKPDYIVNGHSLYLQKINLGNKLYWIGLIDTKQLQINPLRLKSRAPYYIQEKVNMCSKLFAS